MGTVVEVKPSPYRSWSTAKLRVHRALMDAELNNREVTQSALEQEARLAAREIPGPDGQPPAVLMDFRDLELPPREPLKMRTQFWFRGLPFIKRA